MEKLFPERLNLPFPPELRNFLEWLKKSGFSAWIVGGAIRDFLLGLPPKDWDIITDAPDDVLLSSPYRTVAVGARFGVIVVVLSGMPVEVACIGKTTPAGTLEADLARRDFTINTVAMPFEGEELIDIFGGIKDLKRHIIRGVVNPEARFREDPLRVLRAARFLAEYGFTIERKTYNAMKETSPLLKDVAIERIRDEFFKLIVGTHVRDGFEILRKTGAFKNFFPEILEGWMKKQNGFHLFHIYRHTVEAVAHTPPRLRVRLAALFHDIAKPRVRKKIKGRFRFFGHETLSAEMTREILNRWKTSHTLIEDVVTLVKNHMVHNINEWSDGAVRRLINRIGNDLMDDFLDLLRADRLAHGVDPADTGEIDLLRDRISRIQSSGYPRSVKSIAVNGNDIMSVLNIGPGPQIGKILQMLYQYVLDHPEDNKRDVLLAMIPNLYYSDRNIKSISSKFLPAQSGN
ncbi:MAG: CCA tRNA nucleotidyltransferase [Thermodesulforhabdaceae bacterium]